MKGQIMDDNDFSEWWRDIERHFSPLTLHHKEAKDLYALELEHRVYLNRAEDLRLFQTMIELRRGATVERKFSLFRRRR